MALLAVVVLMGCSGRRDKSATAGEVEEQKLVLTGGTLIDGTGRTPVRDTTVVIVGNRIQSIRPDSNDYKRERNAKVIPIDGKFLLPGLIDGHVHYLGWASRLYLANGITSVVDTGNWTPWILAQRFAVANDLAPGPRIFAVGGQIDSPPGSFPWSILVSTETQAREAVRQHIRRGVDGIKVYKMLPPPLLKAIIEEAHAAGLPVRGHITISAREAALLGIDSLEHASGVAIATMDNVGKLQEIEQKRFTVPDYLMGHAPVSELAYYMEPELYADLIRILIDKRTFIAPTFIGFWEGVLPNRKEYAQYDQAFVLDVRHSLIPKWNREGIFSRFAQMERVMAEPKYQVAYAKMQRFIKSFADTGGKVVAGSDASLRTDMHGIDLHRELELLVEAGFSPMQALQAATRNPAELMRKTKDLGTIEPDKLADLIVVNGDPLQDIRNTRKIELVIKDGRIIDTSYHSLVDPIPRPELTKKQQEQYEARNLPRVTP